MWKWKPQVQPGMTEGRMITSLMGEVNPKAQFLFTFCLNIHFFYICLFVSKKLSLSLSFILKMVESVGVCVGGCVKREKRYREEVCSIPFIG